MYCRYCGKKIEGYHTVCSACSEKQSKGKKTKSRKKNILIWLVSAIILLAAIIVLVCLVFQKTPEEKVSTNLNSILAEEKEQLEPESIGTKIAELIFENFSFEVVSANHKEATIVVSSPDIYSLYMSAIQEMNDLVPNNQEEYTELVNSLLDSVYEELSKGNYDIKVSEIDVQLTEDYNIELSYELIDAIYGGLLSLQKDLVNAYAGGVVE